MEQLIKAFDGKTLRIRLFPEKSFTVFDVTYPIVWTGQVNGEGVIIKQLGQSSNSIDDFEFSELTEKIKYYKSDIIKAIDDYLKKYLN